MRLTDMADELYAAPACSALPGGVRVATARHDGVTVTRVEIAREGLERPRGRYVTLEVPRVSVLDERDSGVIDVDATIYCEKASHKGIIIGKQGAMLKKISSLARQDMEKFMGTKVYLETWVKVKENWRDNVNYVRSFGYRDE